MSFSPNEGEDTEACCSAPDCLGLIGESIY